MTRLGAYLPLVLVLSACGGGSGETDLDSGPNGPTPPPTAVPTTVPTTPPYSDLQAPSADVEKLTVASSDELALLLKNGVRRDTAYLFSPERSELTAGVVNDGNAAPQATPAPVSADYSETNVQVAGVDESDYVKYDGSYLYMQSTPDWYSAEQSSIRILKTDPQSATAEEVTEFVFEQEDSWGSQSSLYLLNGEEHADALVSLQSDGVVPFCGIGWNVPWRYYQHIGSVQVSLYDLEDPAEPDKSWQLEIEGMLHHSRKIGDMLYLVTSYLPQLDILPVAGVSEQAASNTEEKIKELSVDDLLPAYSINGGESLPLHSADDCLLPINNDSKRGYRSLHNIVAIDLRQQQISDVLCIGTEVQDLYSAKDAIYLSKTSETSWPSTSTVLHKFNLKGDSLEYAATGSVPGSLGWSAPAFRMDEHEGNLRVLTTNRRLNEVDDGVIEHRLFVLEENTENQTLDLLAQLPNDTETGNIGKPGEDVYAVRFNGDSAYVVTFERIDPLYVLDLAEPAAPKIAGELELPGFSTYLHPMGDGYLFGLGSTTNGEWGFPDGVKAVLFNVRDQSAPKVAGELHLGKSGWSDALYDYKALSFLATSEGEMRISFPATMFADERLSSVGTADIYYPSQSRVMVMLEAKGMDGDDGELLLHGALQTGEGEKNWWDSSSYSRGIMHGDAIFYVDEPDVWGALWSQPEILLGPFDPNDSLAETGLAGINWQLQSYTLSEGSQKTISTPMSGTQYTLWLSDSSNKLSGEMDCNSFLSTYSINQVEETLQVGGIAATEMACPMMGEEGYVAQEQFILNTLLEALSYRLVDDETLILRAANGDELQYTAISD
ncbi:META domain-containing protein [Alteromonadaceae bacterium Bs31]|nr:META domain-containing protein [Alteromonadaceae bacterium Bs31]